MIIWHILDCEKCFYSEQVEVLPFQPKCPECGAPMKKTETVHKAPPPQPKMFGDMGFCSRCGKLAATGEEIDGRWYGPECANKVRR